MFDYGQFTSATVHQTPFRWTRLDRAFPPEVARELSADFPTEGMRESVGHDGHYHLWDRTLISGGEIVESEHSLSPLWRALVKELAGDGYRDRVEQLMGVSLRRTRLLARVCRYSRGMWMLPHTDRPDRVVTQTVYLSPHWEDSWGGALRILNSPDSSDVVHELTPLFNTSVLFVRSDTSFHSVEKVSESVTDNRLSLLLQFVDTPA